MFYTHRVLALFIPLLLLVGCTSFKTTIVSRAPGGQLFKNQPDSKTRGLPVKLKVPSHVEVIITEDFFIEKAATNEIVFREAGLFRGGDRLRSLNVNTKLIYTPKVFTVDFRRPAAGTLTLGGPDSENTFDTEQYFKKIQASYEEKTIEDINTALQTVTGIKSSVSLPTDDNLMHDTREVARRRFDLSNPCWEQELVGFVNSHVTGCYPDCRYQN